MKKLTIGMPVYNGAATIRAALDSLLAQTFGDFQIIISDNGSTDNTPEICAVYVARDPRVTYVRQATSLAPQMNFRFVLFEARTQYFMWAAADDLWAAQFVERNMAALETDPTLVMSQSRVLFTINGAPSHMAGGTFPLMDDVGTNAVRFFENPSDNSRYYGVFRTAALQAVYPNRAFFALDWLVSVATLRHGKHNELPETLMIRDSSDPASYARAVVTDHRFILWRIFPLLFMTRWLIRNRSVPLNRMLLYRLWKANLYIHFLLGTRKFNRVAERYLQTNSLVMALDFRRLQPVVNGLVRMLGIRRIPPVTAPAAPAKPWDFGAERLAPPALVNSGWTFPAESSATPLLSLVIIADTGLLDAHRALLAAQQLAGTAPIQVILVVCVADGFGATTFASLKGVTICEVETGATAGRMINAGTARATASQLLLVPSKAWYGTDILPALDEALTGAPLVSPMIMYPDGVLAAAGGVVSGPDGFWRHGRMEDPHLPRFQFARTCDFATAALAMRREAIQGAQPFDEAMHHFDVVVADFCLRERARLGPPLYWPWVRIACPDDGWRGLEPGSRLPPPDLSADLAKLRETNQQGLDHLDLLEAHGGSAHDRARPRRLLYVDAVTPRPSENAGSIEALSQMQVFSEFGFRITFIPESNFVFDGPHAEALQKQGIEVIHAPYARTVREILESAENKLDVVVLCRSYIAHLYLPMVRALAARAKVIFYTVDLHFLREEREAVLSGDVGQIAAAELSKSIELASVNTADATIVHSAAEQELLARDAPGSFVVLQPLMRAVPAQLAAPGPEGRRDIVFIGTYQHPPNADAATFFAREVWPLIRPRLPEARFLVVGSAITPQVADLAGDGVEVLGFVQDLGPLFDGARLSVAPLRYGAGLKGKVATSLQAGLPTVATRIAAEGVPLEDGRDILLADTAQELADAVVRLYTDDALWRRLSVNGFAFARQEFSFEANTKRIANLLAMLDVSTMTSERIALEADLASGDEVFRPSKFWTELSAEHVIHFTDERLMRFKRTINNCYMQWLPGYFSDPRLRNPMKAFQENPSMLPIEVATNIEVDPDLAKDVAGYGGFNPFANPDYRQFYAFYTGLVWHLMTLHASEDLYTRLEEPELGMPIRLVHKGKAISQDLAQSLLEYSRIRQFTSSRPLPERPTYLELGAGYGRLAFVFLSAQSCRYIIVDIPPTILLAKWYLRRVLPECKIFSYRPFTSFDEVREEFERADLIFLSPNQLQLLPDHFVDISLSISSLHEMTAAQSTCYLGLLERKTSSAIYLKQWIKWWNPLDKIEMSVADYQLGVPWQLSMESEDLANHEFVELGWLRNEIE